MTFAPFTVAARLAVFAAISPRPATLMPARTGLAERLRTGVTPAVGIKIAAI